MNTTSISAPATAGGVGSGHGLSAPQANLDKGYFARRSAFDWMFAALVAAGALFAFMRYSVYLDVYERGILLAAVPGAVAMGWFWRPLRILMIAVAGIALLAVMSYQGNLARAEQFFWLKYFFSSQSAILWMSVLFFMSTIFYWLGMFARSQSAAFESLGS